MVPLNVSCGYGVTCYHRYRVHYVVSAVPHRTVFDVGRSLPFPPIQRPDPRRIPLPQTILPRSKSLLPCYLTPVLPGRKIPRTLPVRVDKTKTCTQTHFFFTANNRCNNHNIPQQQKSLPSSRYRTTQARSQHSTSFSSTLIINAADGNYTIPSPLPNSFESSSSSPERRLGAPQSVILPRRPLQTPTTSLKTVQQPLSGWVSSLRTTRLP